MNSIELKEQEESLDLSSTAKANFDRYLLDDRLRRLHKPMVAASVATALTIAAFALEPVPFTSPTLEISSEYDSANRLEIWVASPQVISGGEIQDRKPKKGYFPNSVCK